MVIERDEDGLYGGEVPQLPACYAQGETIDELMVNIREVIELCLKDLPGELAKDESSSKYDFSDLMGRLSWEGDPVAMQRMLRDE